MIRQKRSEPILSVIVPVYNVEKYVGRCLESILHQTFQDFEVICVDDGSTDGSLSVLARYRETDQRICIIHKKNGGLVSARKAGLLKARGIYATYVDADDWIENNMYQEMLDIAQETDADIVTSGSIRDYGTYSIVDDEKIIPGCYEGRALREDLLSAMIATDAFFQTNLSIHIYNKLYKKEILSKCQMQVSDGISIGEDAVCVYPCMLRANKVAVSGKNYYHYCMRNDSIMGTKKPYTEREFNLFCEILNKNALEHMERVPNLRKQFIALQYYVLLLRDVGRCVRYEHGILYPFGKLDKDDEVVIYGAGRFGCELKEILEDSFRLNIIAWIDKANNGNVRKSEYLETISYDKIIIAVLKSDIVEQIERELLERNIPADKLLKIDVDII